MRRHQWMFGGRFWPRFRYAIGVDASVGQDVTTTVVYDTTNQVVVLHSTEAGRAAPDPLGEEPFSVREAATNG